MLIREGPATELTVATRILARAGVLAPDGRIALVVGSEVVYLGAKGVPPQSMTPYDVAAVRFPGGPILYGEPPPDVHSYIDALRAAHDARAAARRSDGTIVTAASVRDCVAMLLGRRYEDLVQEARASGAMFGAYPIDATE
ncbi:hypothetical protein BH18CHL2_BH18CHL2_07300 [soil metagenome]